VLYKVDSLLIKLLAFVSAICFRDSTKVSKKNVLPLVQGYKTEKNDDSGFWSSISLNGRILVFTLIFYASINFKTQPIH